LIHQFGAAIYGQNLISVKFKFVDIIFTKIFELFSTIFMLMTVYNLHFYLVFNLAKNFENKNESGKALAQIPIIYVCIPCPWGCRTRSWI
jgi:hypothetical protein